MKIKKAYAISDAKISFVSLVDKAANKREFLITKAKDGNANFQYNGRIVKVDDDRHYVTGVVYEPMTEDAHDNYMTEDEIVKAAYWFAKNGDKVDLQHSFDALSDATVVENWVTKSDETIGDETIKKGTWLITVEVTDDDVWEKVQKREITGFSMGGVGVYSDEDVSLEAIEKGKGASKMAGHKSILKRLADALGTAGLDVVEKGAVADRFNQDQKSSGFWNAFNALQDELSQWRYDYSSDRYVYDFENDGEKIREALSDFSSIITKLLGEADIIKSLSESAPAPVEKAGKKMSTKNKERLNEITEALASFTKEFDDNNDEEEETVTKNEVQIMQEAIEKAVAKAVSAAPAPATPAPAAAPAPVEKAEDPLTAEKLQDMIEKAIAKALGEDDTDPEPDAPLTAEAVQKMIEKALSPVMEARGLSYNLSGETPVQKSDNVHFMHGIL